MVDDVIRGIKRRWSHCGQDIWLHECWALPGEIERGDGRVRSVRRPGVHRRCSRSRGRVDRRSRSRFRAGKARVIRVCRRR